MQIGIFRYSDAGHQHRNAIADPESPVGKFGTTQ